MVVMYLPKRKIRDQESFERDKQILVKEVWRNQRALSAELRADLILRGQYISFPYKKTSASLDTKPEDPRKKPFLTAQMMATRLQWAKDHRD